MPSGWAQDRAPPPALSPSGPKDLLQQGRGARGCPFRQVIWGRGGSRPPHFLLHARVGLWLEPPLGPAEPAVRVAALSDTCGGNPTSGGEETLDHFAPHLPMAGLSSHLQAKGEAQRSPSLTPHSKFLLLSWEADRLRLPLLLTHKSRDPDPGFLGAELGLCRDREAAQPHNGEPRFLPPS